MGCSHQRSHLAQQQGRLISRHGTKDLENVEVVQLTNERLVSISPYPEPNAQPSNMVSTPLPCTALSQRGRLSLKPNKNYHRSHPNSSHLFIKFWGKKTQVGYFLRKIGEAKRLPKSTQDHPKPKSENISKEKTGKKKTYRHCQQITFKKKCAPHQLGPRLGRSKLRRLHLLVELHLASMNGDTPKWIING